jgi:glycosyltransferase involved in cell wall biosynthesis
MAHETIDLSLIIACYNEGPSLSESVRQVIETLDQTLWTYELIFVDDCSQDDTRQLIDEMVMQYADRNVTKLFHAHNTGRGRTVSDGFRLARGSVVGYIDIDLEIPAHYIPIYVRAIKNGADVATAHRIYKLQPRLWLRFFLSRGYTWLMRQMLDVPLRDTEAGYKFFNYRSLMPILNQVVDEHWFWDTEIMVRSYLAGYMIREIPCLCIKRYDKQSTVRVLRDSIDYFVKLWHFRHDVKQLRSTSAVIELSSTMAELKRFHSPYRSRLFHRFQSLATFYITNTWF